ncbi:MAG: A/G-specific adenine glycosylase [Fibrobacter sp.]|nr:A/G-specific adenine glycosylase [Fibrobacter sp.]
MTPRDLKKLREWFANNAASLPWRLRDLDAPRDPYKVWISETMLQQTQVATVQSYFVRWMERFPDVEALAKASEEDVFRYWQGLGYYSRARNILKAAQLLKEKPFPRTRKELEALPGIGAYTAGAILSLAYHQREAILDGNLVRIFSRYFLLDFLPGESSEKAEVYWKHAREVADSPKAYLHNEALMELGRRVCKSKNPDCGNCPLKAGCAAFAGHRTEEFPPAKKRVQKDWHGTILVVESVDEMILAVRGGQKFFSNQMTLPHVESQRGAAVGLPIQAEEFINVDQVERVLLAGSFRHNITIHKMECDVLDVKLKTSSMEASKFYQSNDTCDKKNRTEYSWVEKQKASETFANSFCLKALEQVTK